MSIRPQTIGGLIAVADSAELATLDTNGLPPGTLVYNLETKTAFRLTICARRTIVIDPDTDAYDGAGEWILDGGEFTAADEGCTMIVAAEFPNEAINGVWEIESVDDVDTVTTDVVSDHEPTGTFSGTVTVIANALVADEVVAVAGTYESRWIVESTDVEHAETADLADLATLAIAASGPADAAFFTGTLSVASASDKGLMSAADKTKLDGLDPTGWASGQWAAMKAENAALTDYLFIRCGQLQVGQNIGAVTGDGNIEGGGVTSVGGTGRALGATICKTPKTGNFSLSMLAKFAAPVTGQIAQIGLSNSANDKVLVVATKFDVDNTHYILRMAGAAGTTEEETTILATTDVSTFRLSGNGTDIKVRVNDTLGLTQAVLTNLDDASYLPYIFDSITGHVILVKYLYGFVSPV